MTDLGDRPEPAAHVPTATRTSRWFPWALAAATVAGFAIRANYVRTVRSHEALGGDARYFYWWTAQQLAAGHGFISAASVHYASPVPTAQHPPGLIVVLALLQKLGFQSPQAARYWMWVMGTATVVLVGILLWKLAGERAGIVEAVIAATYPGIWINDTMLMSESLCLFGLALGFVGTYAFRRRCTWSRLLTASAGLTIASLTRPESILLFPLVLVPLVLARRTFPLRRRAVLLAGAALVPCLVFVPWTVYNASRFSKPVLISTGFGQTAAVGACDETFSGPYKGYYHLACVAPSTFPQTKPGEIRDESVDDANLRSNAYHYSRAHLKELPGVIAAREGRLLGISYIEQMDLFDTWAPPRGSLRLVTVTHRIYWVLALLALAAIPLWRRRRHLLYPFGAELGITMFAAAITFGNTRYRAGVELCMVILAATSIDWAIGWTPEKIRGRPERGAGRSDAPRVDHPV